MYYITYVALKTVTHHDPIAIIIKKIYNMKIELHKH